MPSAVAFRAITAVDVPALFSVRVATWHNDRGAAELTALGITPTSVTAMLATTHAGWLAEANGTVIGFAIGNRATGEMWVIAVLKPWEGRGIGRRLLQTVEEDLAAAGWREAWLTTDTDEAFRAVGFYRRAGWSDWKFDGGNRYMRKGLPAAEAN
jgi:ribosomal protein S18 acetylase RimI-like enzyme